MADPRTTAEPALSDDWAPPPPSSLAGLSPGPATAFQEETILQPTKPATKAEEAVETIGGYRIERLLGAGGMGAVYAAYDAALGRRLALKVMRPEIAADPHAKARFTLEAKAMAAVTDDHIVPVYHVGEDNGRPFLVMPMLEGEPLDARLKREPRLPADEIARIGREMALGLAAAHARGLIHRDIKPANIWLEGINGRVKILDFGLARPESTVDERLTQTGAILGTPAYMAPEQARGLPADFRADLFSLGVVLYRCATGSLPFRGDTTMALLTALATETPEKARISRPDLPPDLAATIDHLLAKKPEARPASARAVAEALSRARAVEPPRRGVRLWQIAAAAAAGAVLLALLLRSNRGGFIVEIDDPALEARVKNGELRVFDETGALRYTMKPTEGGKDLPAGDYRMEVRGPDGLAIVTEEFKIARGDKTVVRIRWRPSPAEAAGEAKKTDGLAWFASQKATIVVAEPGKPERTLAQGETPPPGGAFRLVTLSLRNHKDLPAGFWRKLADVPPITFRLDLTGTDIDDTAMQELYAYPCMLECQSLFLDRTAVTDAGLAGIGRLLKLKEVWMEGTRVRGPGLAQLAKLPLLHDLNLMDTPVEGARLADLATLRLTSLLVHGCPHLGDGGLRAVAGQTKLEQLWAGDTNVTDEGIAALSGLAELTSFGAGGAGVTDASARPLAAHRKLQKLNLRGTSIGDEGLEVLVALPELRQLTMAATRIGDKGLKLLEKCMKLEYLDLRGCKCGEGALKRLAEALPKCRLLHDGAGN